MKLLTQITAALGVAAWLMLPVAQAASLSKADYQGHKTRIAAEYQTAKAACDGLSGNGKDICLEDAKGREKVALAELEHDYSGKADDRHKAAVARAEAAYELAKERCDDLAGNAKDVCVKEAKAVEVKALADAKLSQQIGDARKDASADKRAADLKVALEKCDALSGDAKSGCTAQAQATLGKR